MLEEVTTVLEAYLMKGADESHEAACLFRLEKLTPHVDVLHFVSTHWVQGIDTVKLAKELYDLELSREHEPTPPFITHAGLLNNVRYLRTEWEDYGEFPMNVLVPLDLEYPKARLAEMITTTHTHATPEEIVAELHRRQAQPDPAAP